VKWIAIVVALLLMSFPAPAQSPTTGGAVQQHGAPGKSMHDREFWRSIAKNHYAVPEGQQVYPLLLELSGYFGSPDSELRDDLAYSITTVWIKHQKQISTDELNSLLDDWQANLRDGIGESGNDSVLKRSFSALCLVALAERDLKMPFLSDERYQAFLANALAYLRDERDLRGFDPTIGWIHATAHTADLLAALAANPLLKTEDQPRLLDAITTRLSSAHEIFAYGEQDRLAALAATIAARKNFDGPAFQNWLSTLDSADQRTWKNAPPHLELLQTFENDTYMLRGLAAYLCGNTADPAVGDARNEVLKILQGR
jgi:Protein of unknown function (DUF2785)